MMDISDAWKRFMRMFRQPCVRAFYPDVVGKELILGTWIDGALDVEADGMLSCPLNRADYHIVGLPKSTRLSIVRIVAGQMCVDIYTDSDGYYAFVLVHIVDEIYRLGHSLMWGSHDWSLEVDDDDGLS